MEGKDHRAAFGKEYNRGKSGQKVDKWIRANRKGNRGRKDHKEKLGTGQAGESSSAEGREKEKPERQARFLIFLLFLLSSYIIILLNRTRDLVGQWWIAIVAV